jgi:uncharacterized phage protein gp47/JayE
MMGIQPLDAQPATVNTTWTAFNSAGHTVRAGTQVGIRNLVGDLIPFYVQSDVVIPPGQTATAVGGVTLIAVNPGAATTNLGTIGGAVELIDVLDWVSTVVQVAPTSGGSDAETDLQYLGRLREKLQLLSPRPITPADFAALAKSIPGVAYAIPIDGYDASGSGTYNNARTISVALLDANGNTVSTSVKAAVAAYLQSLREVYFLVYAIDPTLVSFDVNFTVKALSGFDLTATAANVEAAIINYLSPINWAGAVPITQTVRYLELAQIINAVPGVDYVQSLTFGAHSSGGTIMGTADILMIGPAPLPTTNSAQVTGTAT